ncbi:MAG: KpsF/GutQ family sugar-phosphate isomerase, partial [Planctomycetes bacterium]|nr:KpsF/GutQ family sugar-phosphate isomerase [Planctomycetota bacterium]
MPEQAQPDGDAVASIARILRVEAEALAALAAAAPAQAAALTRACALIHERCGDGKPGRLVVTGVGKAGLIARKVAATFASTGTPALFLHPAEARHGDLGMVQGADVVLAFSNSGASEEIVALLPSLSHIGSPVIAIVGDTASPLGRHAEVALSIGMVAEACPLGLAPSTSTTAMLALGDAVALTVQGRRRFTPEQYARFHPGGALGRKLMTCAEAMRTGARVATAIPETPVVDAVRAITVARAGSVLLVDAEGRLLGIFTDGDLRRRLGAAEDIATVMRSQLRAVATMPCRSVRGGELVQAALRLCAEKKINELPVVDDDGRLLGLIDVQD